MKRIKHHKVKKEKAESSSQRRVQEEHDLAYYIHDRVELMHQVFSILKYKELKSMAPECIRNLAIGDLEELCTEELLGISSKRLLAVLDGVEPPSDTESSSPSPPPEQLETISLDSISSDEGLLSSNNKKKKHKHRRHSVKSKSKKKEKSKEAAPETEEISELSKASRAGLTVLELLELQARARAIRAQLQKEQTHKRPSETTAGESSHHSSENEVEIKEEPQDVVEISSEEEKPNIDQLEKRIVNKSPKVNIEPQKEPEIQENPITVTKRTNDLIITVPKAKTTRKIKLNRNKATKILPSSNESQPAPIEIRSVTTTSQNVFDKTVNNANKTPGKAKESKSKKKKKDKKKKAQEKDGSDHDEITLQLSDSEKMDLLEDLDESRKNYDKVSSSSEDTESSSSDSNNDIDNNTLIKTSQLNVKINSPQKYVQENEQNTSKIASSPIHEELITSLEKEVQSENNLTCITLNNKDQTKTIFNAESATSIIVQKGQNCNNNEDNLNENTNKNNMIGEENEDKDNYNSPGDFTHDSLNKTTDMFTSSNESSSLTVVDKTCIKEASSKKDSPKRKMTETVIEILATEDITVLSETVTKNTDDGSKNDCQKYDESLNERKHGLSDGELSDRQSSEIEAIDVQPEVVCISDEESPEKKLDKKKKKKEKKSKKEKKTRKSNLDFLEGSNQIFYKDAHLVLDAEDHDSVKFSTNEDCTTGDNKLSICLESDDVYEILELSDDSSCYEVEGTVLSKEPTTEEIEALSARIDEIEREEVITDEQIQEHEQMLAVKEAGVPNEGSDENIGNISWKERYLGSKKVKRVLTTANILNALRKKNKELKKKIQDSKNKEEKEITVEDEVLKKNIQLEEGSIEQYNTLQGSTKYVDAVTESVEENKYENDTVEHNIERCEKLLTLETDVSAANNVTKEMKKDAKQLLKMYKKLLKHNDMNKQKDPDKKRKKKQKQKKKDKQATERL